MRTRPCDATGTNEDDNSRITGDRESPVETAFIIPLSSDQDTPTYTDGTFNAADVGSATAYILNSQEAILVACEKVQDLSEDARDFDSGLSNPDVIKSLCCAKVPLWAASHVTPQQIHVSQILSGLTNQLFLVSLDNSTEILRVLKPHRVVFRIYGQCVADLYNADFELAVFKTLGSHESAPKLIAEFEGGRIEEFIRGPTLRFDDFRSPPIVCGIATILARFHRLHRGVPEIAKWNSGKACLWDWSKKWADKAKGLYSVALSVEEGVPVDTILKKTGMDPGGKLTGQRLLRKASLMSAAQRRSLIDSIRETRLPEIMEEINLLPKLLIPEEDSKNSILELAFCHNDVQENNILVSSHGLRLIDFEYTQFNYPAFDIANLFCEMTMMYDVEAPPRFEMSTDPKEFPSEELIKMFASVYLSESQKKPVMPSDEDQINPFVDTVLRFVLASHIVWGLWAIIRAPQAAISNSKFDFLLYAKSRFAAYFIWKDYLISKNLLRP